MRSDVIPVRDQPAARLQYLATAYVEILQRSLSDRYRMTSIRKAAARLPHSTTAPALTKRKLLGSGVWEAGAGGAGRDGGGLFAGRNGSFGDFIEAAEDHFAGRSLVDGGDQDVHGFVDEAASAVDHDHGAVLEVGDALIDFLAFAKDEDAHAFAGEKCGANGVGEKINVEDADALNAGDFIEIEVVGDDFGAEALGKFDQLAIDFVRTVGIVVDDADFEGLHFLNALED